MARELNLNPTAVKTSDLAVGSSVFSPITAKEGIAYQDDGSANILGAFLPTVASALEKRRQEQLQNNFLQGRVAELAKQVDPARVSADYGYKIGANIQQGIEQQQVDLNKHFEKYNQLKAEGASPEELEAARLETLGNINQSIADSDLPAPFKETLAKQALTNFEVLVKQEHKVDEAYLERQYDSSTSTNIIATSRNLVAAVANGDNNAVKETLKNMFQQQLNLEWSIGNNKGARDAVSNRVEAIMSTLLGSFDISNPLHKQALQVLGSMDVRDFQGILSADGVAKLQALLHKGNEETRNYNGVQTGVQLEQLKTNILAGEGFSPEQHRVLVQQALAAEKRGELTPEDTLRLIQGYNGLAKLQLDREKEVSKDPLELTKLSAIQAEEAGKLSQWVKAQNMQALQANAGDLTAAGVQLMNVGIVNTNADVFKDGAEKVTRQFSFALGTQSPESFQNMQGNVNAENAFTQWKQFYRTAEAQGDTQYKDAMLSTLSPKDAAFISAAIKRNPNATLQQLLVERRQWEEVGGVSKQENINRASQQLDASLFTADRHLSLDSFNIFKGDKGENLVASATAAVAQSIARKDAAELALAGVNAVDGETLYSALLAKGNVGKTRYSSYAITSSLKDRLLNAGGTKSISQMQALIEKYQKDLGKGSPENVFLDGQYDNGQSLRFLVYNDEGTYTTHYVPLRDYSKAFVDIQNANANPRNISSTYYSTVDVQRALRAKIAEKQNPNRIYKAPEQKDVRNVQTINRQITQGRIPIKQSPLQDNVGSSVSSSGSTTSTGSGSSGRLSRVQILQGEISGERKALAKEQAELVKAQAQGNQAKVSELRAAVKDRQASINAISRELSREK